MTNEPLATPLSKWPQPAEELDSVVIGSGYGGAVAALRLAQSGSKVVVFERGSEYLPGQFPNDATVALKHLRGRMPGNERMLGRASGVFDWHVGDGVVALTGNGLGGGSLINAGVVIEPTPEVFEQPAWPSALREAAPITLADAFETARRALQPERYTAALRTPKGIRLAAMGGAASEPDITVDLASCTRCGDCATGCNWGAKRTLCDSYLAPARAAGAQFVSNATARWIEPLDNGCWQVLLWPTERSAELLSGDPCVLAAFERRVVARRLVIAAGTFGSTELLQRSQTRHPRLRFSKHQLGRRFSANGDSLSFLVDRGGTVNAFGAGELPQAGPARPCFDIEPTITTMLDRRRNTDGRPLALHEQVLVQDGAVPATLAHFTEEMLATSYLVRQLDQPRFRLPNADGADDADPLAAGIWGRDTHVLLAMGHDGAPGRIRWDEKENCSTVVWQGKAEDNPAYRAQQKLFDQLGASGAVHLHPLTWRYLPESASDVMSGPKPRRTIVTVHPLGGCAMGDGWGSGVVDHLGRPWRQDGGVWDNLWVLDGSIVPTSLGANPLLTITALAERALQSITGRPAGAAAVRPPSRPGLRRQAERAPVDASLGERLVASRLQGVERRFAHAELKLDMGSTDWLAMWRSGLHRVQARGGTLRLAAASPADGAPAAVATYGVQDGWFELLPYRGAMNYAEPAAPARWRERLEWLRAFVTWLECRGLDDGLRGIRDRWSGRGGQRPWGELWKALRVGLSHAAERREMRYRLTLALDAPAPWTDLPPTLTLLGHKQVGYGADWLPLLRWPLDVVVAAVRGRGVLPPKRSFWEQVFNPEITVLAGPVSEDREALARRAPAKAGAWLCGRFEVDLASLLAQAPLRLHTGDLTTGVQALGAYPMLFARHAAKTQLFDFRRPDYDPRPRPDPTRGPMPLKVDGRPVEPELHTLRVARGHSEADPPELADETLELALWRYRAPAAHALQRVVWGGQTVWKAPSVLLLHAFAQSGAMFTMPQPHPSLARHLLGAGFDVWVLDHRISIRLPYAELPSNMVQIARYDIPAAVDRMLETLEQEHGAELAGVQAPKLQVFAMGQCIGGASLAISLLDGRLSYEETLAPAAPADGPAAQLSKLAGAVISQTHPFLVGTPQTRAKTWVPAFIRDAARMQTVPFAVRGEPKTERENWLDRLLASMAVPDDERCPGELNVLHHQDDCATCRRIRFIEAPLFRHANLLPATHRELPFLFGAASVHLFAHAARCVESERLVDDEGGYVFVTDERMRRHFSLPMAFLHGERNELFHTSSATRSAEQYTRLFPALAERVERGIGEHCRSAAWIVPGQGHVDVILGREAPALVFEPMARLFETLLHASSADAPCPPLKIQVGLRPPLVGPMLGALRREDGVVKLRVAFLIDDRFSDAGGKFDDAPGLRTWAMVRSASGARRQFHLLEVRVGARRPQHGGSAGYRIAHGELTIDAPPEGEAVQLLAFSLHETLIAATWPGEIRPGELRRLPPSLAAVARPGSTPRDFTLDAGFDAWIDTLAEGRDADARRGWASARVVDPALRSPSVQRRDARPVALGAATLGAASLKAADDKGTEVEFFAACCRYPGWPFDRDRVDAAARHLLDRSRAPDSRLAFGLLLGDQIYADATAGMIDPLAPVERYFERYRAAFGRTPQHDGEPDRRSLGDLLAALPTYLTPDDHEYRDGFPDGRAVDERFAVASRRGRHSRRVAADALTSFQFMHMPPTLPRLSRNYAFAHGPLRCFVLDTRTQRRALRGGRFEPSLLRRASLRALQDWLAQPEAEHALNCIASGSVLMPRLKPDPTSMLDDSTGWAPADREALLGIVGGRPPGRRMLLLAGDYHLSAVTALADPAGRVFGAAVVTPPLYAPLSYANAVEDELDFGEALAPYGITMQRRANDVLPGSGYACLRVQRCGSGYRVTVARWLQRHEQHEAALLAAPTLQLDIP